MQLTIHQNIIIHQLKISAVTNSSVLQIGTAGTIRSLANLYNTGGFTGPAPQVGGIVAAPSAVPFVPLPTPSR